jgi:tryptophan synthase alpha chain
MPRTIAETVAALKAQNRKALVAYVTAGDPSLQFTRDIILALEQAGVDIIELGVPFGHPVGDGPTIQRSAKRALANGVTFDDALQLVEQLRQDGCEMPIVLFGYHNPLFRYGYENLAKEGARVGVSASLIVDLPPEESLDYRNALNAAGIDTIFLATPLTTDQRLPLVNEATSGFCYYVSRTGVTGGNQDLSASLANELAHVKKFVDQPVFVGFGIRTPEHARAIGKIADGVIVGSAFIDCIEKAPDEQAASSQVVALAKSLRQALDE